jgi:tetratricopeptide (TPR) repeat protein
MTAGRTIAPQYSGGATVTGMLTMAELRPGDVVADRFRIVRLLGMGGMGVVYHAHDTELDVDVALKLLRPELASRHDAFERFRQELLLARQVSSPHVVRIHDLVRHGEVWLISMDFVPGQSLERLLDTKGHLAPEDAIRIVRQLALGLAAAHQRGVVHRDLKPANVLIAEDGEARITDFGVARSAGSTGITVSGVVIGTPEYLSPEQARADPVDGRSDLYALGLIFFEMLTGTLPFRGGTPAEMLAQRIVRDPPSADTVRSDLPAFAVRLCSRLLELKPSRRFQSAEEVVKAIDERRVRRKMRPGRLLAVAAALAVIGAGIVGTELYLRAPATTAPVRVASALDIAVMPLVVSNGDEADTELAEGARRYITAALTNVSALRTPDVRQVDRALAELGYDAQATRRQRERVAETLNARWLLEADLAKNSDGTHTVRYAIWKPGEAEPAWSAKSEPFADGDVANAMRTLQASLERELGQREPAPMAWPDAATLRLAGRMHALTSVSDADANALRTAARASRDPVLWWEALRLFDRNRPTADAASLARDASDAFPDSPQATRDMRRVHAYAELLLDDPEAAAKSLAELAEATPGDHVVRVVLARAESETGKLDEAIRTLDTVVKEDPLDVDAWFALGMYSIMKGDSKRAVDDYLSLAQVKANRLGDERMQANVTNALGVGYQNLGQLDHAASSFRTAIDLRKKLGDVEGEAGSLRNLASIQALQGDFKGADASLKTARPLVESTGNPKAMADFVNDVGVFEEERGEYRKALDAYREALNLRQSLRDPRLIGQSMLNVAFAFYQVGEFDNAQTYWDQAAVIYSKIQDQVGLVQARQGGALAQIARGDFVSARTALEEALHDAESLQMAEEQSTSLSSLAELDNLAGATSSALERAARAAVIFEKREDRRGVVEMRLLRAEILLNVGDADGAAAALDGLTADNVASSEQEAILLTRLGDIAWLRADATEALAKATAAVGAAQEAHSYGTELKARLLRARALHAQKKDKEGAAELATIRAGVAKYASVPLRLQLFETSLALGGASAAADYRTARNELARLPSYVRAFEIHALAAVALRGKADAADAGRAARAAYDDLIRNAPDAQRTTLPRLAGAMGFDVAIANE